MAKGFLWVPRFKSRTRALIILSADGLIAGSCLVAAMSLRFFERDGSVHWSSLPELLLILVVARVLVSASFRLHRWSFRYSGLTDGARIAGAGLLGTALFALGFYLLGDQVTRPPRSVVVLEMLLSTACMAGVRFVPRLAWMYHADRVRSRRAGATPTLIVGAGAAGEMLLRDLRRSQEHNYQVVGFVDDEPGRWGHVVGGKTVLGGVADLPHLATRYGVSQILIAIPRLAARRVREILASCSHLKLQFKTLPVSYVYLQERSASSMLQDLTPQDLLEREEVRFTVDSLSLTASPAGRLQLVTGAAGSIGSEVCAQLLAVKNSRLVMVDIDENGLYLMQRRFEREHPGRVVAVEVADVRDVRRMHQLFAHFRPDDVFHAAARKHVPLMETAPGEAVLTNVLGTLHVAEAARRFGAARFVFMSTDKAVRPTSVMGATKRLGELLLLQLNARSSTRFSVVRFGNVLDSAGSVVPLFREQIAAGGPVTVTHPEVRRYFMTISEAVGLVLRAAYGDYGELCVLEMGEPIRILDLARHMITMAGLRPEVDVAIEFTGLRPGEKLDEELLGDGEQVLRRVDRKICVVVGSAASTDPSTDLVAALAALEAAVEEGSEAVRAELHRLLPEYRSLAALSAGDKARFAAATSPTVM